jgi:hypothetical protein
VAVNKTGKPALILLAIMLFVAFHQKDCFSAAWLYVLTYDSGNRWCVDVDSIKVNTPKKEIKLWRKTIKKNGSYMVFFDLYNYGNKTHYILQTAEYKASGKLIDSHSSEPSKDRKLYIMAGTVDEAFLDFVLEIEGLK